MTYNVAFHFTMIVIGLKLCKALSELLFCMNSSKPMQITRLRYHYSQPIYIVEYVETEIHPNNHSKA